MVGMDILFQEIRIWFVSLGKFHPRFISYDISMDYKVVYGILIGLGVMRLLGLKMFRLGTIRVLGRGQRINLLVHRRR